MKRTYTTGETASIMGVSSGTIINWTKAGKLRYYKLPTGMRRFRPDAIMEFCIKHHQPVPEELTGDTVLLFGEGVPDLGRPGVGLAVQRATTLLDLAATAGAQAPVVVVASGSGATLNVIIEHFTAIDVPVLVVLPQGEKRPEGAAGFYSQEHLDLDLLTGRIVDLVKERRGA